MGAPLEDFDLSAAWYRKAQGDLRAFMAAFAARMAGAIPDRVTVETKRDHFLSPERHVVKVSVDAEPNVYVLTHDKDRLSVARAKSVRGVILKSEAMALSQWLAALDEDVRRLGDQTVTAGEILYDFLTSSP